MQNFNVLPRHVNTNTEQVFQKLRFQLAKKQKAKKHSLIKYLK